MEDQRTVEILSSIPQNDWIEDVEIGTDKLTRTILKELLESNMIRFERHYKPIEGSDLHSEHFVYRRRQLGSDWIQN